MMISPHLLEFDVVEQRLGIERCIQTDGGSYRVERCGPETEMVLRTSYRAYLRPRLLWRRLETVLMRQLHKHILLGIEGVVLNTIGVSVRPPRVWESSGDGHRGRLSVIACPAFSVAAVWLYEGLWCKILGGLPSQETVVTAVPRFGPRFGVRFLKVLGVMETALAIWVMSGRAPGLCALVQTALLIVLNLNGLLWARRFIHDPAGMVVKNVAFLVLVWVCGATS